MTVNPGKVEPVMMQNLKGGAGVKQGALIMAVKMVIFLENAGLSFLHRWTKTDVINTMISFIIQRMLCKGCYQAIAFPALLRLTSGNRKRRRL